MNWTFNEVVDDWLNSIDMDLIYKRKDEELWHTSKTITLDSIITLEYIRRSTDNIHRSRDNRILKLLDMCMVNCRHDYFERFLGYRPDVYHNQEGLWWIDCWESIRLNNILCELHERNLNEYYETSEGEQFDYKWQTFFKKSDAEKYDTNSLKAFSYLVSIRLLINLGRSIPIDDLRIFFDRLCELKGNNLILFPRSNELRTRALGLIQLIDDKLPGHYNLEDSKKKLIQTLKFLLKTCKWDKYCYTWAPIITDLKNNEIISFVISKISENSSIDTKWVAGNNYVRKPRYALFALIDKCNSSNKYFELVEPNRSTYAPSGYINNYTSVIIKVDSTLQGLSEIKDIQKKVQDGDIVEGYFRDLIQLGIKSVSEKDKYIKWVEKERDLPTGRQTDIYISTKKNHNIPIEVKLLWRFNEGYEPIIENLEQITEGSYGIIIVIDQPNNPMYQKKYQGFDGWKLYVQDHETYTPGTLSETVDRFMSTNDLKTQHFFSDHHHNLGGRDRNITLLSFYVDLRNFIRSQYLKSL